MSSRVIASRRSSSRGRSERAKARNTASRRSAPSSASRRKEHTPSSLAARDVRPVRPGSGASRSRTCSWGAAADTSRAGVGARERSSSSGVPAATFFPWWMMSRWSHTSCTSERMWELKITVCCRARSRIRVRISMICWGSRPTVGSSRISTLGKPSRAWARPTRCR